VNEKGWGLCDFYIVIKKIKTMKHRIYTVIRYIFGVAMTFFGISNLFQLLPPHQYPGEAGRLMLAFTDSGYILQAVGLTQLFLGIALLLNRFIPLALLLFAPVVVNVLLFHLFLDVESMLMAMPVIGITTFLFIYHKSQFSSLLKAHNYEKV
jgi:putative oxidoreductase